MKELNSVETKLIAGAFTCEAALIEEALYWSIDDITEYCTQEQFTKYALGMVELVYSFKPDEMTPDIEIDMIKGLSL
jgi:hypothetical protein